MRRRRRRLRIKKRNRGRGILYIYKNKVYLGKKTQTGSGTISRVVAGLLESVEDVIGL